MKYLEDSNCTIREITRTDFFLFLEARIGECDGADDLFSNISNVVYEYADTGMDSLAAVRRINGEIAHFNAEFLCLDIGVDPDTGIIETVRICFAN